MTKKRVPWNKGLKGIYTPWNKGLTKSDPRVAKNIKNFVVKKGTTYIDRFGEKKAKEVIKKITSKTRGATRSPESIERYRKAAKLREQKHKENGMTDKLAKEHSKFMKEYANRPENIERSRKSGHDSLRKIALKKRTRIEQFMEDALKQYGINFIPESVVYVKGKVRYRVDFELPDEKVFVECDGKQWHQDPLKDKRREDIILAQSQYGGYKFERFWGSEIYKDVNKCVEEILCTN